MSKLFKIKAEILINKDSARTWPIHTGYRPGFVFFNNMQTSGAIDLINVKELYPGEQAVVIISFVSSQLLGDIELNTEFKFYEGPNEIGSGRIIEIIGLV